LKTAWPRALLKAAFHTDATAVAKLIDTMDAVTIPVMGTRLFSSGAAYDAMASKISMNTLQRITHDCNPPRVLLIVGRKDTADFSDFPVRTMETAIPGSLATVLAGHIAR